MASLVDYLTILNRKERFFVVGAALASAACRVPSALPDARVARPACGSPTTPPDAASRSLAGTRGAHTSWPGQRRPPPVRSPRPGQPVASAAWPAAGSRPGRLGVPTRDTSEQPAPPTADVWKGSSVSPSYLLRGSDCPGSDRAQLAAAGCSLFPAASDASPGPCAVRRTPDVTGRRSARSPQLPADLSDGLTLSQAHLRFPELGDDLLDRSPPYPLDSPLSCPGLTLLLD